MKQSKIVFRSEVLKKRIDRKTHVGYVTGIK